MSRRGPAAPWLAQVRARLGVETDAVLAAEVGVSKQRVALVRRSLGIPPAPTSAHKPKGGPRGGGRPRRVEPETAAELRRYVAEGVRVAGEEVALTVAAAREVGRKLRRKGITNDTETP